MAMEDSFLAKNWTENREFLADLEFKICSHVDLRRKQSFPGKLKSYIVSQKGNVFMLF